MFHDSFHINNGMRKHSNNCKCGNPKASGSSWCLKCKSDYMKIWRMGNPLVGEARKRMNARSYLHVYVKRGKVKKEPCSVCGNPEVEAHHDDYNFPLKVKWFCKFHHLRFHGKYA